MPVITVEGDIASAQMDIDSMSMRMVGKVVSEDSPGSTAVYISFTNLPPGRMGRDMASASTRYRITVEALPE